MRDGTNLNLTLERAAQARGISEMARAAALATASLLAVSLAAVLADAVLGFDAWVLLLVDAMLIAGVIFGVAWVIRAGFRSQYEPRRMARLLETSLGISDSRLINAVELSGAGAGSASLCAMVVEMGDSAATQVKASAVIDRRGLKHDLLLAGCAAVVLLGSWAAMPRLFATVVPRYVSPGADLPAFTFVEFKIGIEPQRVYFGKPATLHATLSSPFSLPEIATVVFDGGDGRRERAAMIRSDAGQFVLAIDRAERSHRFYVDTPQGRSGWRTLEVLPVPLFEKVTVRYEYPAYTGWLASEMPLDAQGIKALIGTIVTVTVQSNLKLDSGKLAFEPPSAGASASTAPLQLAPVQGAPESVTGYFVIATSHRFFLSLKSYDGTPNEKDVTGDIVAVLDAPPQVQLLKPDLRITAPEGFKVPVSAVVSDDLGVKEAVLHSRVNDRATGPLPMPLNYRNPTYAAASQTLDLAMIGARAGDTVRGFVTAYDNHPSPPQSADSPTLEIAVVTEEQYKALAREEYRIDQLIKELEELQEAMQKLDEARDKLVDRLEKHQKKMDENKGALSVADKKEMEQLLHDLEKYSKDSKAASEQMKERANQPQLYEFEQPYTDQLKKTAKELRDQADAAERNRQALSKQPSAENVAQALKDLAKDRQRLSEDREQSKMTEEQLKKLQQAEAMIQGTEEILDLAERQKALADKLSRFHEGQPLSVGDRERLQRLTEEQRQLQQQLHETTQRLEKQAKEARVTLPKMSESVRNIVDKIRELNVEGDQQDAAEHGRNDRGYESYEYANSASKKLGMMIGECLACNGAQSTDLDGTLNLSGSRLSKALEQMAQGRRGSRPGSTPGTGSTGRSGNAAGGQSSSSGGQNSGKSTLLGPRSAKSGGELGDRKRNAGSYNPQSKGPGLDDSSLPQQISPASRGGQSDVGGAGNIPQRYRGLAEQYFRRLAQDNR